MTAMTADRKVLVGAAGGALATILVWVIGELTHKEVPTLIAQAFQTLGIFGLQWAVPNKETPPDA